MSQRGKSIADSPLLEKVITAIAAVIAVVILVLVLAIVIGILLVGAVSVWQWVLDALAQFSTGL